MSGTDLSDAIWRFLLWFLWTQRPPPRVSDLATKLDTLALASISATGLGQKVYRAPEEGISFRSENCLLKNKSRELIQTKWQRMQGYKVFKKVNSEKRFGKVLNIVYHAEGHLAIGEDCKKNANDSDTPMVYSEVSARDPTFYRLRSVFNVSDQWSVTIHTQVTFLHLKYIFYIFFYFLYTGGMGTWRTWCKNTETWDFPRKKRKFRFFHWKILFNIISCDRNPHLWKWRLFVFV